MSLCELREYIYEDWVGSHVAARPCNVGDGCDAVVPDILIAESGQQAKSYSLLQMG